MQHTRPEVKNKNAAVLAHIAGSTERLAYLMPGKKVFGDWTVICQDVHNLRIGQLMTSCDILAIHFGTNHMVADRSVHMVRKVQHSCTLQVSHVSAHNHTKTQLGPMHKAFEQETGRLRQQRPVSSTVNIAFGV